MNKINALIVEDKKPQMELLAQELKTHCPNVAVIGKAYNCKEALKWLEEYELDLFFLDIELPDGDGFSILKQYNRPNVPVIFVTGHEQHWKRAFEMSAIDYLLKPIDPQKLSNAVDRAMRQRSLFEAAQQIENVDNLVKRPDASTDKIGLKKDGILNFYYLKNVLYLLANGEKTVFRFEENNSFEQFGLLGDYETLLAPYPFLMRIHRSHIANLKKISSYNSQTGAVYLEGCKSILKVGEFFKIKFEKRLKDLGILFR